MFERVEGQYRGTSHIRNSAPLGSYCRTMPRALWWSSGGGLFLMSEEVLYMRLLERVERKWHEGLEWVEGQ